MQNVLFNDNKNEMLKLTTKTNTFTSATYVKQSFVLQLYGEFIGGEFIVLRIYSVENFPSAAI